MAEGENKEQKQCGKAQIVRDKKLAKLDKEIGIDRSQPMWDSDFCLTEYGFKLCAADRLPNFIEFPERGILRRDRHGLSFPTPTGLQLRLQRNGKDLGQYYAYSQYGNPMMVVRRAIEDAKVLKDANPKMPSGRKRLRVPEDTMDGVGFRRKVDSRRLESESFYWVEYYDADGKRRTRTFSLGYTHHSLAFKAHAEKTANYFRLLWEREGAEMDIAQFEDWLKFKLYEPNQPACDFRKPRRKKGESIDEYKRRIVAAEVKRSEAEAALLAQERAET